MKLVYFWISLGLKGYLLIVLALPILFLFFESLLNALPQGAGLVLLLSLELVQ